VAINSIAKGKDFERKVAQLLTKRFGVKFARTPRSGAFGTTSKINAYKGDIFTTSKRWNEKYNATIECKSRKTPITLEQYVRYLIGLDGDMLKWVKQCIRQSTNGKDNYSDFWLIFKYNFSSEFIVVGKRINNTWVITDPIFLNTYLQKIVT